VVLNRTDHNNKDYESWLKEYNSNIDLDDIHDVLKIPYLEYLNVIFRTTDYNNKAYDALLDKDESVKELLHISDIFDFEEDNDKIGDNNDPLFDGTLKPQEVALNDLDPIKGEIDQMKEIHNNIQGNIIPDLSEIPSQIHVSPELQERLRDVCYKYKNVFSRFVKAKPADVPPMKLEVDKAEWERPMNRLPARPQSVPNRLEIQKQLQKC
jgi:hypothetical protein